MNQVLTENRPRRIRGETSDESGTPMRSSHALALALGVVGLVTACGTDSNGPNISPAVTFTPTCALLVCTFSAAGSGADRDVVAYRWDFGDGATAETQNARHSYASAGTYDVVLTLTDDNGETVPISRRVTVKASQPGGTADTKPQGKGQAERPIPRKPFL
jgi:PKD repeat protein